MLSSVNFHHLTSRYDDESNLMGSIKYIQQVASGTLNIGRMMQSVYTNFFSSNNNDDQRSVATAVVAFIGGIPLSVKEHSNFSQNIFLI